MAGLDFDSLRVAIHEHVSPRSAAHCDAVAEEAARLAARYGVDVDAARIAGLLHDWARDESSETLLNLAEEYGIPVGPVDRDVPYLLHAQVGAAQLARDYPDLGSDVLDAVARHTTGAVGMSDLDAVVYVADMIEPARGFDGVEELRAAVGAVTLEDLFAHAYATSLRHLIDRRRRFHPATLQVWNALVTGGRP